MKGKSVAIVAMGSSSRTYVINAAARGGKQRIADEVWAINSMGAVIQHDLLFHMDDCKIQEARAALNPDSNVAGLVDWLKGHPKFMTSTVYPEYPGAIEYPLEDVINKTGSTYFNNTVPYAVAYAIYKEVGCIKLYGCDYSYPDAHKAEAGRACMEWWIDRAVSRKIEIEIAEDSSLLDVNVPQYVKPYGYDAWDVTFEVEDKKIKVVKKARDKLPSPEEMDKRYKM